MSCAIAPSDRKPCALETTSPDTADCPVHGSRPCALLCADAPGAQAPKPATPVPAPPEDESADPVGDGHSDAEWAEQHPKS